MKKALLGAALVGAAVKMLLVSGGDELLTGLLRREQLPALIGMEQSAPQPGAGETAVLSAAVSSGERERAVSSGERSLPAAETRISAQVEIRNDSGLEIDLQAAAQRQLRLELRAGQPQILIIHTHGSEAFSQTPGDLYEESDPYRTQDCSHNVVGLGDALERVLESYGLEVLHDRGIYDYPSYTGSYTRSGEAVEDYLSRYPGIEIVIDLHRDAIGSGDVVYKTVAEVEGQPSAQVMLLVGTGANGLAHPGWQDNLTLALAMQSAMDRCCPTLARPLAIKSERYNQHLSSGSLILEVGSTGNSFAEALRAVELFGNAVGPLLAGYIV